MSGASPQPSTALNIHNHHRLKQFGHGMHPASLSWPRKDLCHVAGWVSPAKLQLMSRAVELATRLLSSHFTALVLGDSSGASSFKCSSEWDSTPGSPITSTNRRNTPKSTKFGSFQACLPTLSSLYIRIPTSYRQFAARHGTLQSRCRRAEDSMNHSIRHEACQHKKVHSGKLMIYYPTCARIASRVTIHKYIPFIQFDRALEVLPVVGDYQNMEAY